MFRHSKNESTISSSFENEFAVEVLRSDRLRVTILIGVIAGALLVVSALAIFSYDQFQRTFHGNFRGFLIIVAVVAGFGVLCLSIERAVISYLLNKKRTAFGFFHYLSAFIETSIPTAAMVAVESLVKRISPSDESVTNEKGKVAALP